MVDRDGAGRGDRLFDLMTLRFDLARRVPGPGAWLADLLDGRLAPDRLRAYWARMCLRQVDWSIRHHGTHDVDLWLDVAEIGVRRYA